MLEANLKDFAITLRILMRSTSMNFAWNSVVVCGRFCCRFVLFLTNSVFSAALSITVGGVMIEGRGGAGGEVERSWGGGVRAALIIT